MTDDEEEVVTVAEAARLAGVSVHRVYGWISRGVALGPIDSSIMMMMTIAIIIEPHMMLGMRIHSRPLT